MTKKENHLFLLVLVAIILILWANIYSYIEWWAYLDSFYFIISTITTVGYWDFVPTTPFTKILTMCYAISIIPIVFYFWPMIIDSIVNKRVMKLKKNINKEIDKDIKPEIKKDLKREIKKDIKKQIDSLDAQ